MASSVLSPVKRQIDYPSSDGKPMAESSVHYTCLTEACSGLQRYFRHRPDVFVAGNLLIYYKEGEVDERVAPDVFVVMGVGNHDRSSYLLWKERTVPSFVLEITSRSTRREDQGKKRELYGRWGVREYWQYDPLGEWLKPPLRGLELAAGEYGEYGELPSWELADGTLAMASGVLGLELRSGASGLRFHDTETGRNLLTRAETEAARERAERGREQERQARQRAEQERERAEQGRERAEQEREQAERARQQAERARQREKQAREAAEARVAELEALARRERPGDGAVRDR